METRPLVMFVHPSWRREASHIPLLFPQWGIPQGTKSAFTQRLHTTHGFDASLYRITDDSAQADIVLMPYRYHVALHKYPELAREAIETAKKLNKRLLIDAIGDVDYAIDIPHAIVLKYGGYRFLKQTNEIVLPPYTEDLLEKYCNGTVQPRPKASVPSIGFAGWTDAPRSRRLYWRLKGLRQSVRGLFDSRYQAFEKGVLVRHRVLRTLQSSPDVNLSVIQRPSYSGHVHTAAKNIEVLRREFVENILASDLCLDIRGDSNASTRLFEILSLGRVPLIVDTERNFPFSDELDYRSFAIMVDFRDMKNLGRHARSVYDAIAPDEWLTMQERARAAYRTWFRTDALTAHLMRRIRTLLTKS